MQQHLDCLVFGKIDLLTGILEAPGPFPCRVVLAVWIACVRGVACYDAHRRQVIVEATVGRRNDSFPRFQE